MRIVVALLVLAFVVAAQAVLQCTSNNHLFIRDAPCGKPVGRVVQGTAVPVYERTTVPACGLGVSEWSKVEFKGKVGWIASQYLSNCISSPESKKKGYYGGDGGDGGDGYGDGGDGYGDGGDGGDGYGDGGDGGDGYGDGGDGYGDGGDGGDGYGDGGDGGDGYGDGGDGGDGYGDGGDGYGDGGDGGDGYGDGGDGGDGYGDGGDGYGDGGDGYGDGGDGYGDGDGGDGYGDGDGHSSGGGSSGGHTSASGGGSSGGHTSASGGGSSGGHTSASGGGTSGHTSASGGGTSGGHTSASGGGTSGHTSASGGGTSASGGGTSGHTSGGGTSGGGTSGHTSGGGTSGGGTSGGTTGGGGTNYGVDVSVKVSADAWKCLKGKGYSFAVIRAYRSSGSVDPNANANLQAAQAAGLNTDIYMFPCPKCSASPEKQVSDTLQNLKYKFGIFWLDVEDTKYWTTQSANQAWIQRALAAASKAGVRVGVYTSKVQWSALVGASWSGGSQYPLWYAHYDKKASFSDFSAFGGWSSPAIKQYNGDTTRCGVGVDENYVAH